MLFANAALPNLGRVIRAVVFGVRVHAAWSAGAARSVNSSNDILAMLVS
jgi:hypothetical protein